MLGSGRLAVGPGLLLLAFFISSAQGNNCAYFTAIPKEERPDFVEEDFSGISWSGRPLLPPPQRPDLCLGEYVAAATFGTQQVYIDEEIVGDVIIAKLNYDGTAEPYIGTFLMGRRHLLNAVIRREPSIDNAWYLVITERQDYETAEMRQYMFEVRVEGEATVARVSLEVVNIDDNPPVIHFFEPCSVPEASEPGLTDCTYEVTDVDGEISTRFMTFRLDSDRGDDQVFSIYPQNLPNDWYTMTITLRTNQVLDYEASALHIFSVTASDSLPNNDTVSMMVQVENVESRDPRWVEVWAVQQFDEKTTQSFTLRAIDGDTGINKPIYYRLEGNEQYPFFWIETIEGGHSGAIFHVDPIDRDELEQEVFQLSIVAYKYLDGNDTLSTETSIVIIVNDVNDQIPEPLSQEYWISIPEETPLTLSFDEEFGFHDRDLGEHAQYQVHLEDVWPPGAAGAFYVAPEVGYQRQLFTMGTTNHSMLDYEVEEFQAITVRVVATDLHTPSHVGVATVHINLTNWNDEEPMFDAVLPVRFDETEGAGYHVAKVTATDRDIDDRVVHTLLGNVASFLSIDEDTGDIYVSADEAFDYHRQSELVVQIRADDTLGEPYHTTTTQLVIQLNDINNTPPTLRLPRGSPQVEENVPDGFLISDAVSASDPDSTAELVFHIDWNTSYATKQGRETDPQEYHGCVEILTEYPTNMTGVARGRVVAREIRPGVTIDFEEFEVLYLTVRVTDLNTVLNEPSDELTFTITIVDMNDNAPQWVEGTLDTEFRVREGSAAGVVIGSVLATDIDGPLYNQVRYNITPREDTPPGLVKIDSYTGQIDVDTSGAIDADEPARDHLYYTVVASDRCVADDTDECPPDPEYWETPGNITIIIMDTNNKYPEPSLDLFNTTVYIYENATHLDPVLQLYAEDLDRDEIYHTVRYQINYQVNLRIRDFFSVDLDSGLVFVDYTTTDVLDRDGDEPTHRIFLTLFDNFYSEGDGNRNQADLEVLVVLLDVNDNAPELPPSDELSWSLLESTETGTRLSPDIYAPDRDEPGTDNSRVAYEILSLSSRRDDAGAVPELFQMVNINNVTGELETAMPLVSFWGTYDIHIRAYDHGVPQQSSNETYEIEVRPYNYHAPVFTFPQDRATYRLQREAASVYSPLMLLDGGTFGSIAATDEDGLHAGEVNFEVIGDDEAVQHFTILNDLGNVGTLVLTQIFTEQLKEFQVTIRAVDGGTEPGPLAATLACSLVFVPALAEPAFTTATTTVAFVELDYGLTESHQLPLAEDPKNYQCTDDCHQVYYHIYGGNEAGYFSLAPTTNVLSLSRALDRSETDIHLLTVVASNSPSFSGTPTSLLTVVVNVREADPRPVFSRALYTAGVSTLDSINRELLTVHATHTEDLPLEYSINITSMKVDPSLENVKESAFVLNPESGVLSLNMQPTAAMQGMFEFYVVANDTAGATGSAEVRVYLISTLNRVYFIFHNTVEEVENNRDFIASTFSSGFNMTCNVDVVLPAWDASGAARTDAAELRAHFVREDMPVDAAEIESLRSDTFLLRNIQLVLYTQSLQLEDVVTDASGAGAGAWGAGDGGAVAALAALAIILAASCAGLLLVLVVRTRALNRRLEALSTTKFAPEDKETSRAMAVPGTNKHALAGSNPMWNEQINAPDFDALSDASGDSDLIGIENLPQFQQLDNPPPFYDSRVYEPQDANMLPTHSNSFGFPSSTFGKQFTHRDYSIS